ncbi:MAG: hypothetical protein ACFCU6_06205 [Balneolaceae bacterium]
MRYLIADSGGTKTDWCYIENGKPVYLKTEGLHPFYLDPKASIIEVKQVIGHLKPERIWFYGAGCVNDEKSQPVRELLESLFPGVRAEFRSDLCGAGRAFFGDEPGIAAILGTGSGSGVMKGGELISQVPPLGYILGDEGSAADIGKRILKDYLRNNTPDDVNSWIQSVQPKLNTETVYQKLYVELAGSKYLGSISGSILRDGCPESMYNYVEEAFHEFVRQHLLAHKDLPVNEVAFTGGVAVNHQNRLQNVLREYGFKMKSVSAGIIGLLYRYHSNPGSRVKKIN